MIMLLIFTLLLATALFPGISLPGTKQAVEICLFSVIPALFPFFVLNHMLLKSGAITDFCNRHLKAFGKIFRLPPASASAVILGFLSGYPTGIKAAGELYSQEKLTTDEYRRLTAFCGNAGPAFITGTAGLGMMKSAPLGTYLLLVHITSAVFTGLIFSIFRKDCKTDYNPTYVPLKNKGLLQIFCDGIYDSMKSVSIVCGFVIFFGCITSYMQKIPGITGTILTCITEMTNGISALAKLPVSLRLKASLISACIGWGGLCVHAQSFCFLKEKRYYIAGKTIQGIISFITAYAGFSFFQKL